MNKALINAAIAIPLTAGIILGYGAGAGYFPANWLWFVGGGYLIFSFGLILGDGVPSKPVRHRREDDRDR